MTTEAEVIEGEVHEVGLTVIEPREVERLDETATPEGMVALAARMATALADIVEKKQLYTVISGKKYPAVEAWMTIGRMDNVAAREIPGGVHPLDIGGFEAEVELIRLSDGMQVGYGSAYCGTPGDVSGRNDWTKRAMHHQRSMAVTRATSRAFRQRYSWIMALAGYEPTPADEMPGGEQRPPGAYDTAPNRPEMQRTTHENGLTGKVARGPKGNQDFELRQSPDDTFTISFRLKEGNRVGQIVVAEGSLALELDAIRDAIIGQTATVWGTFSDESFDKVDKDDPSKVEVITFKVLHAERVTTPDGTFPAPETPTEAPTAPLFGGTRVRCSLGRYRSGTRRLDRRMRDRVTPQVALAVFQRDNGCVAPRLGGTTFDCWGRNRIEHVQDGGGRMGRRASSDMTHLVTLCEGHTETGMRAGYVWATDKVNRARCRRYLDNQRNEAGYLPGEWPAMRDA